jgi:hypothetical protein
MLQKRLFYMFNDSGAPTLRARAVGRQNFANLDIIGIAVVDAAAHHQIARPENLS